MSSSSRGPALRSLTTTAFLIPTTSALPLAAQGLANSVQIHGFGGWAYAETDGNEYFVGTPDGS